MDLRKQIHVGVGIIKGDGVEESGNIFCFVWTEGVLEFNNEECDVGYDCRDATFGFIVC